MEKNSEKKIFDAVVVGSGPAGYAAAVNLRELGKTVCIVEKAETGGTCLNRGCIPTKAILHSAEIFQNARESGRFGVHADNVSFDFQQVLARKAEVVAGIRQNQAAYIEKLGIVLEKGDACIEGTGRVRVGDTLLECTDIIVAAGAKPAKIPVAGSEFALTSDDLLADSDAENGARFFRRLVIIGGGVIGMEFAVAYSSFGAEVTVIETMPRVLAVLDREIAQNLSMILKKRGVTIITGAKLEKIERESIVSESADAENSTGFRCFYRKDSSPVECVAADGVLAAAGRTPNTANLFAASCPVELTERGFIRTDEWGRTSVSGIYAAGDITGGIQLAHAAESAGERLAAYIVTHAAQSDAAPFAAPNRGVIPSCIYTAPEIACAGITADEAKERGIQAFSGKGIFGANGKALIENQERGFIKLVFDASTRALIGAQMMCNRATDLIAWAVQCINCGITVEQIRASVFAHPTYAETIAQAAKDAAGRGA